MTTYLYCVRTESVRPPVGLAGIDGAHVHSIDAGRIAAWVSDVGGSVEPTVGRLKAHDAVCAAAMTAGETPLPIRFGQTFDDDASAEAAIVAREASLRARLERVSGCVELRVVVTRGRDAEERSSPEDESDALSPDSHHAAIGPGTAFLRRLAHVGRADLAREVGCEAVRHAVRMRSPALIVAHEPCESARGIAFFPVLVRRPDVDSFRSAVSDILQSQRIEASVLGPFAPYSFAAGA